MKLGTGKLSSAPCSSSGCCPSGKIRKERSSGSISQPIRHPWFKQCRILPVTLVGRCSGDRISMVQSGYIGKTLAMSPFSSTGIRFQANTEPSGTMDRPPNVHLNSGKAQAARLLNSPGNQEGASDIGKGFNQPCTNIRNSLIDNFI